MRTIEAPGVGRCPSRRLSGNATGTDSPQGSAYVQGEGHMNINVEATITWTADDFELVAWACTNLMGGVGREDDDKLARMAIKAEATATALRRSDG